jgi:uncharacterized protein
MLKNIFLVILIFILALVVYRLFFHNPPLTTVKLKIKDKTYNLEVAKTIPQQSQGLMNRPSLCPDCGMIFVFGLQLPQVFWMKNTLIPLDMIFLDSSGQVINIKTATVQTGTPDSQLNLYHSLRPVKYVIELNAGDAKSLSLTPGDIIDISSL